MFSRLQIFSLTHRFRQADVISIVVIMYWLGFLTIDFGRMTMKQMSNVKLGGGVVM